MTGTGRTSPEHLATATAATRVHGQLPTGERGNAGGNRGIRAAFRAGGHGW